MAEDRNKDKKHIFFNPDGSNLPVSLDIVKTVFIGEGLSAKEIAKRFDMPVDTIQRVIDQNKLEDLRAVYIRQGLTEIQNVQLTQAQKLMDMESNFKRMRLLQLEKTLEDFMAYYARHGHFYKVHPVTGEILMDTNGIPMQIRLPNVTKEIMDLKESVSLSEGLKVVLGQIDALINKKSSREAIPLDDEDDKIIDATFSDMFKVRKKDEE